MRSPLAVAVHNALIGIFMPPALAFVICIISWLCLGAPLSANAFHWGDVIMLAEAALLFTGPVTVIGFVVIGLCFRTPLPFWKLTAATMPLAIPAFVAMQLLRLSFPTLWCILIGLVLAIAAILAARERQKQNAKTTSKQ